MQRVPFAINSYRHDSLPLSAQRVVNWFAETQPVDAKTRIALLPWPCLRSVTTVGTGPIRNQIMMDGVLYVVSGNRLYSVNQSGVATDLGSVGINSTGQVSAAHNGTQLVVVNDNKGWVYDRTTSTLAEITDPGFRPASSVTYLDGFHIFTELNSDRFFISDFLDPTSYDALDFATAEGEPDPLLNIAVNARQLYLFGTETIEVWYNSGADFPFDRLSGAYLTKGLAARNSIARLDNTLFWLGSDKKVYRLAGFSAQRISTHAIEQAIASFANIGDAEADTITYEGHDFYVLTFPGQATFVYDAATQLWHERESFGRDAFRACCMLVSYGGLTYAADRSSNRIYAFDDSIGMDDGDPMVCKAVGAPYYDAGRQLTMGEFEAIFETGVGTETGQGEDPLAMLRYSDNGGRTWSNTITRSIGKRGDYDKRVRWHRLGRFIERAIELSVSDPVRPKLLGANARIAQ